MAITYVTIKVRSRVDGRLMDIQKPQKWVERQMSLPEHKRASILKNAILTKSDAVNELKKIQDQFKALESLLKSDETQTPTSTPTAVSEPEPNDQPEFEQDQEQAPKEIPQPKKGRGKAKAKIEEVTNE